MRGGHHPAGAQTKGEEPSLASLSFPVRITSIRPQHRDPGRVSLFSDETFVVGLDVETLTASGFTAGMEIDEAACEALMAKELSVRIGRQLISWLSVRDHSRTELRRKSDRKFGRHPGIDGLLDRMETLGLLDEARYAERLVRDRSERRGWGEFRIREELKRKGVPASIIDSTIGQGMGEEESLRMCLDVLEKKKWYFDRLDDPMARRRRMASHLQRRGFPPGIISRALSDSKMPPDAQEPDL